MENKIIAECEERVKNNGHRTFVGGATDLKWYHVGKMQYHYLVSQGLEPNHKFLDVACGSLRLGQWLIPMLNQGNYYGIDGTKKLIKAGLSQEMLYDVVSLKKPHFAFNYDFNLNFIDVFDFAIAQSLLTHLTLDHIKLCFKNIKTKMHEGSKFYCTFFEGDETNNPEHDSHPSKNWRYEFETLERVADEFNLKLKYIGDWEHPVHQKIFCAKLNNK